MSWQVYVAGARHHRKVHGRWPLVAGQRVYVCSAKRLGNVTQIGRSDVAVCFVDLRTGHLESPRVFLWDEWIIPTRAILEPVLGTSLEEFAKEVPSR